jgi:predicted HD phosphohydrolase
MKTVSFTRMEDGTEEDYLLLQKLEKPYVAMTADRIMRELMHQAEDTLSGYQITRLDHARQVATRALRDGADDDWVCSAPRHRRRAGATKSRSVCRGDSSPVHA